MNKKLIASIVGTVLLGIGPLAYAKKDGGHPGAQAPQHMSQQGMSSSNSPMMGQEKGSYRADERRNQQGMQHGMDDMHGKGQQGQGKDKVRDKEKKNRK